MPSAGFYPQISQPGTDLRAPDFPGCGLGAGSLLSGPVRKFSLTQLCSLQPRPKPRDPTVPVLPSFLEEKSADCEHAGTDSGGIQLPRSGGTRGGQKGQGVNGTACQIAPAERLPCAHAERLPCAHAERLPCTGGAADQSWELGDLLHASRGHQDETGTRQGAGDSGTKPDRFQNVSK